MTTRETIIGVAVGVVLIAGVVWYSIPGSRRKVPASRPSAAAASPSKSGAATKAAAGTNAPVGTNALGTLQLAPVDRKSLESRWLSWARAPLRDPFLVLPPPPPKAVAMAAPVSQLQLNGLWLQTDSRMAVINQAVYGEGDSVSGFKILRIEPDKVLVQGPEKTEVISFTSFVPGSTNRTARGTNWVETFLGPEKESLRY